MNNAPAAALTGDAKRALNAQINALKARDNVTNWWHIARVHAVGAAAIILGVWAWELSLGGTLDWFWLVPITVAAILTIGATQHQFGAIIHEGTHYTLFAHRTLNEAASDWLAAFPIYTTTHAYRLHHFAHHQFVNDPDRDPNIGYAGEAGHGLDFPVEHIALARAVLRLLWPPSLVRYMVARAKYSAIGTSSNPFAKPDEIGSPLAIKSGLAFVAGVPAIAVPLIALGQHEAAIGFILVAWCAIAGYYAAMPSSNYPQSRIDPTISHRSTSIARMTFIGGIYLALSVVELATGRPAWGYYGLFWILPLFTAFPVFMIFREWVQHGNADRGRLTNSRVLLVDPVSRYAVFPMGMDYHLPHHLCASVPHYNLRQLHSVLQGDPQYAGQCQIARGWLRNGKSEHVIANIARQLPTIVATLGPAYAVNSASEAHVNEETLEHARINDRDGVAAHVAASRAA